MADLTLTAIYDGKEAGMDAPKVLKMAQHTLKLLRAIERGVTKKRRATQRWDVNIYSLSDRAVVEFTARRDGERPSVGLEELHEIVNRAKEPVKAEGAKA